MKIVILGSAHPLRGGLASYNERLAREYMKQHDFVLYVGQRDLYELSGVVGDEGLTQPATKSASGKD